MVMRQERAYSLIVNRKEPECRFFSSTKIDMRKNILITSVTFLLFTFSSCLKVGLSNKREDYLGENLRIDGFYYQKKSDGTLNSNLYFFYKNGVIFELRISNDFTDPAECV
jgi:hypothetical protein